MDKQRGLGGGPAAGREMAVGSSAMAWKGRLPAAVASAKKRAWMGRAEAVLEEEIPDVRINVQEQQGPFSTSFLLQAQSGLSLSP